MLDVVVVGEELCDGNECSNSGRRRVSVKEEDGTAVSVLTKEEEGSRVRRRRFSWLSLKQVRVRFSSTALNL